MKWHTVSAASPPFRVALTGLVAIASALPAAACVSSPRSAAVPQNPKTVAWADCGDGLAGLQCTTVPVPVDWAKPNGARISLRVAKAPATRNPAPTSSILVIPGGPGWGINQVHAYRQLLGIEQWTDKHDVYLFDPRGVGASRPIRCALPDPEKALVIRSQARFAAVAHDNRVFAASCEDATGELFRHLSSADTARDIEAIRLAVGQHDGLTAYSGSYGTNYAGAYLERYGEQVRSLVMDGVVDHSVSLATFASRNASAVEDAFNRFARWCDTSSECVLHGQDVRTVFDRLVSRPTLPAPGAARPATGSDVLGGTADLMSGGRLSFGWPAVAAMLKKAAGGDASEFVTQPTGRGLFRGVVCSDFTAPTTYGQLSAPVERLRHKAPRFGEWKYWDVVAPCIGHPYPATNPPHRLEAPRNPHVLVSNNTHDPATPLVNALAVWHQLPGARLLTAHGDGHQTQPTSQCARDSHLRFLEHPDRFQRFTICQSTP